MTVTGMNVFRLAAGRIAEVRLNGVGVALAWLGLALWRPRTEAGPARQAQFAK